MLLPVLIVSSLVHLYSISYMSSDPHSVFVKYYYGEKLPNSENPLKLLIPSYNRKIISGWRESSGMVISHKISENGMGNCGSKTEFITKFIKEQRVNGNWCGISHLRCTLNYFERNNAIKKLSNQLNKRQYSNFSQSPWFWSGLIDAEGSFCIILCRKIKSKVGWRVLPKFQIGLHVEIQIYY